MTVFREMSKDENVTEILVYSKVIKTDREIDSIRKREVIIIRVRKLGTG